MDWAQKQIDELNSLGLADANDCCRAFIAAYKNGDSVDAYEAFASTAKVHCVDNGQYFFAIFPDRSAYADWKQGIDRFYEEVADLAADDDEVENVMREGE